MEWTLTLFNIGYFKMDGRWMLLDFFPLVKLILTSRHIVCTNFSLHLPVR
jgi:hypothetical protein